MQAHLALAAPVLAELSSMRSGRQARCRRPTSWEPTVSSQPSIDGVLVQWGERLFYPRNRIVTAWTPRLRGQSRAAAIRSRIEATVRRTPQVMVKVTGGGRGMGAIRAHFRYITKNGRLDIEDDRGAVEQRQGRRQGDRAPMAVRRRLHRRGGPPSRSLQRHAVDAAGHRSAHRSEERPASSRRSSSPTIAT